MSDFHISLNNSHMVDFLNDNCFTDLIHSIMVNCDRIVLHFQQENVSYNLHINIYFWSQQKMSGFLQNNVRDPRSQDPDFLELCPCPLP